MSDVDLTLRPKKRDVTIEYCVPCDYSADALRTAETLVRDYQHVLNRLELVMGSKGVFDVKVDGDVIFSKEEEERHPQPGEVLQRFRQVVGADVETYPRQEN